MRVLDLFSGIGGFSLGLERAGFETVAFCEIDQAAQRVLRKHWPDTPIFDDVNKLCRRIVDCEIREDDDEVWCHRCDQEFGECECVGTDQFLDEVGAVDVITAGFPCQDISVGKTWGGAEGIRGGRSGLWSQACRIIRELEPRYAIIENVPALLHRGLEQVVQDLDAIGYDAEWNCISAAWAGGEQARDRVWIVANAKGERVEGLWSQRIKVARPLAQPFLPVRRGDGQWEVEPDLRRSAYGVSTRLDGRVNSWGDRLKQCGNAVCPQIAEMIGRAILSAA